VSTEPLDLDAIRERAKGPLHEALHTLGPRIPNLAVGDCHCNLLTEVALDALAPALAAAERRGYERAVANLDSIEVVKVVIAHQRRDIGNCLCGWGVDAGDVGKSHSRHVLAEIVTAVRGTDA